MKTNDIFKEIKKFSNNKKAKASLRFFKTAPGQYGHGDQFLGLTVPESRTIAKKYAGLDKATIQKLLNSVWHEERLIGLMILVHNYEVLKKIQKKLEPKKKTNPVKTTNQKIKIVDASQKKSDILVFADHKMIVDFYLKNKSAINNWDLVDLSSYKILGDYCLQNQDSKILFKMISSKQHWDRRMAMVSSYAFIKNNQPEIAFALAEQVLGDKEDLMHKASGWMLREAGKRDLPALKLFIKKFYSLMPRTMLRYSIEKFSDAERRKILHYTSNKASLFE